MALELNISNSINSLYLKKILYGLNAQDNSLYIRIKQLSGNKQLMNITTETLIVNGESLTETVLPIINYNFIPSLEGDNFIEQGYNYLKTLPEFIDCDDC